MFAHAILKIDEIETTKQPINELSQEEKEDLKESIKRIGLLYPLVVTQNGDKYKILDGRTRFQILKQLKWNEVPCLIVQSEDDWMEKQLRIPYEVEIFRRHLSMNERKKYQRFLKEQLARPEVIEEAIHTIFSPRVAKKIEETLLNKFDHGTVKRMLVSIKNLPEEKQLEFLEKITPPPSSREQEKIETLENRIKELKAEKEKMSIERDEERRQFVEELKAKVERELNKRKRELEARYKNYWEELDEDDRRRIMEEVRQRIYSEYRKEIDDFNRKNSIMAKTIRNKDEEIKNLKEQVRSLKDQCKRATEEAEKYQGDIEYFARVLESLKGVDRLKKELSGILEELQSIKKLLIDLGEDYTMEIPKEGINEVMAMLKDISKTAREVEGLFREYS